MAIRYNTGSTPNTSWTNFTSDGTSNTDEIYVRTSTATGAFSTSSDQKVSKVYYHNGSNWVEVFTTVAAPPPVTPTLSQVTGFNFGTTWNTRVTQVNMVFTAVTNATSYVLTATNVNDPYGDVKTATLTSSTTGSKNLTVTGLTPGQTYSFSIVAKASGYNDSPASPAGQLTMGSQNVLFGNVNITPEYYPGGPEWLFSESANVGGSSYYTTSCNIGNRLVANVPSKTDSTYVGYKQVTTMRTYFRLFYSGIPQTNGSNFDTFLVFNGDNGGAVTYNLSNNWIEAVRSQSPGSNGGDFGVYTYSTGGLASRSNSGCTLNSSFSFIGTSILISGSETTSNSGKINPTY